MNKLLSTLTAFAVFGVVGAANAASINFTSAAVGALVGTGKSSVTFTNADNSGVDMKVNAYGGTLTYQSTEGLGVSGVGSVDLNPGEALKVSFSAPVDIQSIGLTDLDGNSCVYRADSGVWIVSNQQGVIVQQGIGYFNGASSAVTPSDTLSIDLSSIVASISSVMVVPLSGGFNLGSVAFTSVARSVSAPELSAAGFAGALLLLAGFGLMLTGKRRRVRA